MDGGFVWKVTPFHYYFNNKIVYCSPANENQEPRGAAGWLLLSCTATMKATKSLKPK